MSGCSKDSLYEAISKLLFKTGLNFLDRDTILWDQDGFQAAHKDKFRQLVESGEVSVDTLVYDTTLNSGAQFEEGQFLKPLGQSWHKEVFI